MSMLLFVLLSFAWGNPLPDCSNPHDAADTLLRLQSPQDHRLADAAQCLNVPPELESDRLRLAVQLKKVLDARGLYVPVDELPTTNELDPPADTLILLDKLPVVYLERVDGEWLYSEETVLATPGLYRETFSGLGAWLQEVLPAEFSSAHLRGFYPWQGVFALLLLGIWALASLMANLVLQDRVRRVVGKLGLVFDQRSFDRTRGPMRLLLFGAVLLWGTPEAQLGVKLTMALLFVAKLALSVGAVLIFLRWIGVIERVMQDRARSSDTRMDDQVVPLVATASRVAVAALGIVFVLQNLGVDVGSIVAGLGIGGIALALGAQDTLANLFGSLTIFIDRPFQVGDAVVIDGSVEGTVEEVGFRSTRIRTFNTSLVTLPNSKIANARIDNLGKRRMRRLKFTAGLTYDTPTPLVQAFVEGTRAILAAHPMVWKESYEVHFRGFGPSALDVLVYAFLDVPGWHDELVATSEILFQMKELSEELGVAFAFPTQSVWMEKAQQRPVPEDLEDRITAYGPDGRLSSRSFGITHGFNAGVASERGDTDE